MSGYVHKMAKPKITCSKIFIFQPILEFKKHFHYTEANAVKLSTFQWPHYSQNMLFLKFSQGG
jgi:hypothetical protein